MSMLLRRYHNEVKKEPKKRALSDFLSYDELKALAKQRGIDDYHKMKKSELIDVLKDSD